MCRYDGEVISKEDKICHKYKGKYKGKYIDIGKDVRDMLDGKKYNVNFEKVFNKDTLVNMDMYQSPITELYKEIDYKIREEHEKQIFEAVQNVEISVDKEELIKALKYDRDQYRKGFADAKREILDKIYKMYQDVQFMDCTGYDVYCEIKKEIDGEEEI